jgi:hypothetical protein
VYVIGRALSRSPGALTTIMICALAAQIWTGLSLDSFRNVYYWLWLAALFALPGQVAPGTSPVAHVGGRFAALPQSNAEATG